MFITILNIRALILRSKGLNFKKKIEAENFKKNKRSRILFQFISIFYTLRYMAKILCSNGENSQRIIKSKCSSNMHICTLYPKCLQSFYKFNAVVQEELHLHIFKFPKYLQTFLSFPAMVYEELCILTSHYYMYMYNTMYGQNSKFKKAKIPRKKIESKFP